MNNFLAGTGMTQTPMSPLDAKYKKVSISEVVAR